MPDRQPGDGAEIRRRLLALLARREHTVHELVEKLSARGFDRGQVAEAAQRLAEEALVSDERFVESFVRSRIGRGHGPLKIRADLRQRGVDDALIDTHLSGGDEIWAERSRAARVRRFGSAVPSEPRERARQMRHLSARGFSPTQVRLAFRDQGPDR